MSDIVERAKLYLAHNAAESGSDALIMDLVAEIESLRKSWLEDVGKILTNVKRNNTIVDDAKAGSDAV